MKKPAILYRYEADPKELGSGPRLEEWKIISPTPRGSWVSFGDSTRWVSASGFKRFAYPTKHEAMTSYITRKMRYVENCRYNLARAERQYATAKKQRFADHADLFDRCDFCLKTTKRG